MYHHRFYTQGLAVASHLIADENTGYAAIIDPVRDIGCYLQLLKEKKFSLLYILETHLHADFVSGSVELKNALEETASICVSGEGGSQWQADYADHILLDQDELFVGEIAIRSCHTPGHTPEHLSYLVYDPASNTSPSLMFTGDFIFVGTVGRPDLLGENEKQLLAKKLYHSIFTTIKDLPNSLVLHPSHGAGSLCGKPIGKETSTTLGEQRKENAAFQEKPEGAWTADLMEDMPKAPPYFSRMKKINKEGPDLLRSHCPIAHIPPKAVRSGQILDLRNIEDFAKECIPGSINIAFGENFSYWAPWILSYEESIYLVTDESIPLQEAISALQLVGLDSIVGAIDQGIAGWKAENLPTDHLFTFSSYKEALKEHFQILDVRSAHEFAQNHLPNALSIPLTELAVQSNTLDKSSPYAVICGSGYRASIACSILRNHGFTKVGNILGGMQNI